MCAVHSAYGKFACKLSSCGVCREDKEAERRSKRIADENDSMGEVEEERPGIQRGLKKIPDKLKKVYKIGVRNKKYELLGGFPKSFEWLMEHLVPV